MRNAGNDWHRRRAAPTFLCNPTTAIPLLPNRNDRARPAVLPDASFGKQTKRSNWNVTERSTAMANRRFRSHASVWKQAIPPYQRQNQNDNSNTTTERTHRRLRIGARDNGVGRLRMRGVRGSRARNPIGKATSSHTKLIHARRYRTK